MKLGSLFDGIGGFSLVGSWHDIEPVWASEIEEKPISITKRHFPNMKHLGDITKIKGSEIEPVDVITFGSPCFTADTLVTTAKGLISINEVAIGDKVLTHNNRFRTVANSGKTGVKQVLKIYAMGIDEIKATPNHMFYVRKKYRRYPTYHIDNKVRRGNIRCFNEPEWVELQNIDKDYYMGVGVNQENSNTYNLTEEECFFIGRYIADGYIKTRKDNIEKNSCYHNVIYCVGKHKAEYFEKQLHEYHACKKEERTVFKYEIVNKRLMDICLLCGKGAKNKEFPNFIVDLPINLLQIVINGYMSGDGCRIGNTYKASSVSRKLIYSLAQCVAKAYKTPYAIYKFNRPETHIIEGRVVNQRTIFNLTYKIIKCKEDKAFYENGYIWFPINKIEKDNVVDVYDITVEEDHSFMANGVIVHNCQDLSVAGKRAGLAGKRSNLFLDAIRIIREMRNATNGEYPRFAVWENVPGAFSSNKGQDFKTVLEEIGEASITMPNSGKWAKSGMVRTGTADIAWRTLDAQYWGVPQRRKRIFLVADFGGECTGEILFKCESVSRYFTPCQSSGQRIARNSTDCVREAGQCSLTLDNVASTLRAGAGAPKHDSDYRGRLVLSVDNHAQDCRCKISKDNKVQTLSRKMGVGGGNIPMLLKIRSGCCGGGDGALVQENRYVTPQRSNISKQTDGDLEVQKTVCIQGSMIGRADKNGPQGDGVKENVSYTLNTVDRHAVCYENSGFSKYTEGVGTLRASGGDSGGGSENLVASFYPQIKTVRRLTPLECERLQGFPDNWTKYSVSGELISDTQRYKALGNSVALPCVEFVLDGIATVINNNKNNEENNV